MGMKVLSLLSDKNRDAFGKRPATLAFLGDSVTNGCFEVLPALNLNNEIEGFDVTFDSEHAYSADLRKILFTLYPKAQINIINAGISGDNAPNGLTRMERDLLPYKPDLTVVCYGLNDSGAGDAGIDRYHDALVGIIEKLKAAGSEVILMTPQPIAARVHSQLKGDALRAMAKGLAENFANGGFDRYMQAARKAAEETGIPLCDCYARWMQLYANGVDITDLLANYLNHPTREMHWLFAMALAETMFAD
ncbi:MAG: GDSL-type esterase/lipase family protein [Clostridia bacterium]|nr:GDSL-type esterase/lipase family protein [Clostridia bacterium]